MANVGSQIPVFQGAWSDQSYLRGDLVLRSGVLYQAVTDTSAQPGATSATPGKGNPASWVNVTALVLDFTGSVDPTAGAGIPAAISSTYRYEGTGLYVKTGSGATAWSDPTASAGGSVVSCLLALDGALNIRTDGANIEWDALYDNSHDFNALLAIPAGLGLTFAFDGSSAVITTTEAGTWVFACQINRAADATWQGYYNPGGLFRPFQLAQSVPAGQDASDVLTDVLALPSGVTITPQIGVSTPATANPYTAHVYLSIVRLG